MFGAGNTSIGDRAQQADDISKGDGNKQNQQSNIEDLKTGKQLLDDGGLTGMFFDSQAENMYDEIMSALVNKDGDVSSQASNLASLIGFGKQAFQERRDFVDQEADLLRAIEAIKTTDEFKSVSATEKLNQLLDAIKGLDGTVSKGLFTNEETANRRTDMNTDDRNKLVSTMEELIREIRNQ